MDKAIAAVMTIGAIFGQYLKEKMIGGEFLISTILTSLSFYLNLKFFEEINKVLIVIISLITIVFLLLQCVKLVIWIREHPLHEKYLKRIKRSKRDKNNNIYNEKD